MPVPTVSGLAVLCTGSVDGRAGGLLNKVCRFVRQLKNPFARAADTRRHRTGKLPIEGISNAFDARLKTNSQERRCI